MDYVTTLARICRFLLRATVLDHNVRNMVENPIPGNHTEVGELSYKTLAQLLEMVAGLERDLGLETALPVERDILAVIGAFIESGDENVRTEAIATHPLLANVPRSTLHRALRSLVDKGIIRHPEGRRAGRYVLC